MAEAVVVLTPVNRPVVPDTQYAPTLTSVAPAASAAIAKFRVELVAVVAYISATKM